MRSCSRLTTILISLQESLGRPLAKLLWPCDGAEVSASNGPLWSGDSSLDHPYRDTDSHDNAPHRNGLRKRAHENGFCVDSVGST